MRRMKKALMFSLLVVMSLFVLTISTNYTFAKTSETSLMNKALANGLKKCYSATYMKSSSGSVTVTPSNTYGISSLMTSEGRRDGVIQVPSKVGNTLKDADISCEQLFTGWNAGFGTGKSFGLLSSSSVTGKALLEKLDYQSTSSGKDTVCVYYTYDINGANNSQTNGLCFPMDASERLNTNTMSNDNSKKSGRLSLYLEGGNVRVMDGEANSDDPFSYLNDPVAFTVSYNMTKSAFESAANGGVKAFNNTSYNGSYASNGKSTVYGDDSANIEYVLGDAENAMKNLTGYSSWDAAAFTTQDKYDMYMGYLNSIYNLYASSDCSSDKNASQTSVPVKTNGEVKWCTLSGDMNSSKNVNIVYSSERGFNETGILGTTRVNGVIEAIRALDVSQIDLAEFNPDTGSIDDTINHDNNDGSSDSSKECYSHSGALGWLICPIIKGVSDIGEKLWRQIENYHMKIPARDLFQGESGARSAWEIVRNIANILFVILFMIVIFSQLTGIGIDNYGIKKILPKLIVVAVLINLSYIICELAIDLSNVAGVGVNDLLSNAASTAGYGDAGGSTGGTVAATGVLAALGGGAAVLWVYLSGLGVIALGLAVLGIVITVAVAVFFIYIILVIREAGVILLVVLSPIAIACYLLPNTEKIYKKWFDLFKALLIVYPLCGAMIGAGKLAGAVLSQIDQPSMKVAAMIVQVLPFFLIPMLLRSSLSLMGNIGTRLTNMGRNLGQRGSRAAQGAVRNTDYVKRQQENLQASRAQRIKDRLERRGFENLSDNQKRRLNEAQRTVNAHKQRQAEANVAPEVVEQRAQSARDTTELKAYQDQFAGFGRVQLLEAAGLGENGDGNSDSVFGQNGWFTANGQGALRMHALLEAMEKNGMEKEMAKLLKNDTTGAFGQAKNAAALSALTQSKNKVFKAYGKKGGQLDAHGNAIYKSYKDFMSNGGMKAYARDKGTDLLDGMDDKALAEIRSFSNDSNQILSDDVLFQAAARINSQDATDEIDQMVLDRIRYVSDYNRTAPPDKKISYGFSGAQLASFNDSTVRKIVDAAKTDLDLNAAIRIASNGIINDPKLASSLSGSSRDAINEIRNSSLYRDGAGNYTTDSRVLSSGGREVLRRVNPIIVGSSGNR